MIVKNEEREGEELGEKRNVMKRGWYMNRCGLSVTGHGGHNAACAAVVAELT